MLSEKIIDISECTSRQEIRKKLILTFLNEEPGCGTGNNSSKYTYIVETISDNQKIFLSRPAILNKGMDFVVNVENHSFYSNTPDKNGLFRKLPAPAHHNIISDLKNKKNEDLAKYAILKQEIQNIFNIQPYNKTPVSFDTGMPVEMLLGLIKWLFIEQDITYWNFSGRNMLMTEIDNI